MCGCALIKSFHAKFFPLWPSGTWLMPVNYIELYSSMEIVSVHNLFTPRTKIFWLNLFTQYTFNFRTTSSSTSSSRDLDNAKMDTSLFVGREFCSYKDLQDVLESRKTSIGERWKVYDGRCNLLIYNSNSLFTMMHLKMKLFVPNLAISLIYSRNAYERGRVLVNIVTLLLHFFTELI